MLKEYSDEQRRVFIDTEQVYSAFLETRNKFQSQYKGSMVWKKSKGKEYLFRLRDSRGNGSSLGVKNDRNIEIYENFHQEKLALKTRLESLKEQLSLQAKYCKANRINRVPSIITAILRKAEQDGLLDKLQIVGTNAIYAYEAMSGISFPRDILATQDMDILWDSRAKLKLTSDLSEHGLLGLLKAVDPSFEKATSTFRAHNKDGFYVDLIKPMPVDVMHKEDVSIGGCNDLEATEVFSQKWLVSSPKLKQIVIGEDGFPATMPIPDPRSFSLHKLWLSQQPERDPKKKPRDKNQAIEVANLVTSHLPNFQFTEDELRMFPSKVVKLAKDAPIGFDF